MPIVNHEMFKLAVQLAGPSLANRELLAARTNESVVVTMITNAYNAVNAAQQALMKG